MTTETNNRIPTSCLEATSCPERNPPSWFARLLVVLEWFKTAVVPSVRTPAYVPLRRRDALAAEDALLWLLSCAVSGSSLRETERVLRPFATEALALWDREKLFGRSTLTRFFAVCDREVVAAWRSLFYPA